MMTAVSKIKLGVNVDHVATLRQARGTQYPSVVQAALRAEEAGADSITIHWREDRRQIQDAYVYAWRPLLQTKMNIIFTTLFCLLCQLP